MAVSDMDILAHARMFGIGVWLPNPGTTGGTVFGPRDTVSEARMHEAAERLFSLGYLTAKESPAQLDGRRLTRYEITAAGRAAARKHEGTAELTVDIARGMHAVDLARVYGDMDLAQSQLELRGRARQVAQAALAELGYKYSGTGGWHVLAHATAEGLLGFVNIAQGVAVVTDVRLDEDVITACTVPGQSDGPVASGAAAWTAPDAGQPHGSEAPVGWRQLLVDLRAGVGVPRDAAPVEIGKVSARVVAWCLRTCYTASDRSARRGQPGALRLEPREAKPLAAEAWPYADGRRAELADLAEAALERVALALAALVAPETATAVQAALRDGEQGPVQFAERGPGEPRLPRANIGKALAAFGAYRWESSAEQSEAARQLYFAVVTCGETRPVPQALRECGVARLVQFERSNIGGLMYWDLCRGLFERTLRQNLQPVADALYAARAAVGAAHKGPFDDTLKSLAASHALDIARRFEEGAAAAYEAILAAYSRDGYIAVDFPVADREVDAP